ncbi:MAG: hypothetical protein A3F26_01700 [Candidatus Ryanbacteria bacterium RIFCSPHIGHO2_12_FULL_47_12b]|uniref:Uncharacterized protein n=1 Tax=Candidatus Ryanbacteria bacterium RIFCSPLOWO2_12_FULL_47_9c TaxID=1802131 RepID=A0A1G2H7G5_9BACT|nr:MAG: hypothetical protein A3F26_01700 [Candidatus Ryanbacteria bacterium RIFCSPHIGHO2_12_FULL_47_12b]OGZ52328.1 MAG: hypothetical protein A3A29_01545 [Candidatus Ryanbacteria bacterium RIFCSPLOWO2_01_FULL_47_79]OGZ58201.1 MAG: hypothetical protein A3G60_04060 [Candidatus Ryanbacteria bacterium RIFCSPLOWO2_12_FULL_47_9c]
MAIHAVLAKIKILRIIAILRIVHTIAFLTCYRLVTQLRLATVETIKHILAVKNRVRIHALFIVIAHEYEIAVFIKCSAIDILAVYIIKHESI